jgi:hypothetical protein
MLKILSLSFVIITLTACGGKPQTAAAENKGLIPQEAAVPPTENENPEQLAANAEADKAALQAATSAVIATEAELEMANKANADKAAQAAIDPQATEATKTP